MKYHLLIVLACGFLAPATVLNAQTPTDSLALADSLLNAATMQELTELSAQATLLDSLFAAQHERAAATAENTEAEWKAAKKDTTLAKEVVKNLETAKKEAQKAEKTAGGLHKRAASTLAFARKTQALPPAAARKNLPKLSAQVMELNQLAGLAPPPQEKPIAEVIGVPGVVDAPSAPAPPPTDSLATGNPATDEAQTKNPRKPKTRSVPPSQRYQPYDPKADVMLNPPTPPCVLAQNTRDEFSGETYREVQRAELFRFTNEYVKKVIPAGQSHIVCEAALAEKGPTPSLWLTFTIHDPNARKTFGGLNKNGVAILKFIDGQTLSVYNQRADEGVSDPSGDTFIFRAQYGLDRDILRKMQRTELDKIRIGWATGYEDYDIQNINLLRRQANCF